MGMPSIDVVFTEKANTSIRMAERGIMAIAVKDASQVENGQAYMLLSAADIPETLSDENKSYIERGFIGYVNPPRKIYLYVLPEAVENLNEALAYFETVRFDYLVGPPDLEETEAEEVEKWIKAQWGNDSTPRAVLPHKASDFAPIVNFTTDEIKAGDDTYTAAQYCSRMAGMICGTPLTISCTSAPLPEVEDVKRMTRSEMDTAVDNGEFIIWHDGEKVKIGRGVTSLKTVTERQGVSYKKIKIIDTISQIKTDLKLTLQDTYQGKYPNSYDNKCLLITALQNYFSVMEQEGILQAGFSTVEIDIDKQLAYLRENGVDVESMSEDEIKKAATGSHVFLKASIHILDAIEDIAIEITI